MNSVTQPGINILTLWLFVVGIVLGVLVDHVLWSPAMVNPWNKSATCLYLYNDESQCPK